MNEKTRQWFISITMVAVLITLSLSFANGMENLNMKNYFFLHIGLGFLAFLYHVTKKKVWNGDHGFRITRSLMLMTFLITGWIGYIGMICVWIWEPTNAELTEKGK